MSSRARFARLRHPLAALLAVGGVVVGSIAAMGGSPASAAGDDLVGSPVFNCKLAPFPDFPWNSTITLSAVRPAGSTTVTVIAKVSQMSGVVPVALTDYDFNNTMKLKLGSDVVTLTGSGKVNALPKAAFDQPDLRGTFTSSAVDAVAEVTNYDFAMPAFGMESFCLPTAGAAFGTLKIVSGTPPTPTPTPTTTTTATATPTPSPTASASVPSGSKGGKPAKGSATFACLLSPIGSKFDYNAKVTVSGYRAKEGDDVTLTAKMSDLPAISPVPIQGSMDYTLAATAGGKAVTLKSTDQVNAAAKVEVPVKDLTGTVGVDGDELEIKVSKFTFNFPSASIGAECTAASPVSLGKMTVGSEPTEEEEEEEPTATAATPASSGGVSSGAGTLPKTGGGDSLPVVGLWALALTLLGAAGLLCVPQVARKRS
ncbi:hypothetical protein [Nocardioides sp. W7]|uniref:hypothetical protein n=1 Tax=Nocardioides sp. W7 TaxID=2931390 RepID=UPI001FD2841C|nr:hypothetical protein [Nocardioides sp. W7]